MKVDRDWANYLGTVAFAVAAAVLGVFYVQTDRDLAVTQRSLEASKASERKAWQSAYDAQENKSDEEFSKETAWSVKEYELNQKINACEEELVKVKGKTK